MVLTLTNEEVSLVIGALDTLGTVLADCGHEWTDGERAVYEEAMKILGVKEPE